MTLARMTFLVALVASTLLGCGDSQTVVPTTELTEAQLQAIKTEDAKVAEEESQGSKK